MEVVPNLTVVFDDTTPVRVGTPISVTVTSRTEIYGFTSNDIYVANGTVGSFVGQDGGKVYTFEVTPTAIGEVALSIPAGAFSDEEGNGNVGS